MKSRRKSALTLWCGLQDGKARAVPKAGSSPLTTNNAA